jgi:hypothetical protein
VSFAAPVPKILKAIFKGLSPQSAAFLIVLAVLGVTFTTVGILLKKNPLAANLFISLGGSALGSALSIVFVRIFEPSQLSTLVNVLTESNRSSILATDEKHYSHLRKRLHGYLRSHNEDGTSVWRYRVFDFGASFTPGHLHAVVEVPRPNGRLRKFIYDGYICGDNLVLIGQPMETGSEQHVVHVFPDALKSLQVGTISGICFVDSYDNTKLLTPTILSDGPLTSQTAPGSASETEAATLSGIWKRQMGNARHLNFDPAAFKDIHP